MSEMEPEALMSIKYLAIGINVCSLYGFEPLLKFRNLEKVTIVSDSYTMYPDSPSFVPSKFIARADDPLGYPYGFSPLNQVFPASNKTRMPGELDFKLFSTRYSIRYLAFHEHQKCSPSCTHSEKWKVPKVEVKVKTPFESFGSVKEIDKP